MAEEITSGEPLASGPLTLVQAWCQVTHPRLSRRRKMALGFLYGERGTERAPQSGHCDIVQTLLLLSTSAIPIRSPPATHPPWPNVTRP